MLKKIIKKLILFTIIFLSLSYLFFLFVPIINMRAIETELSFRIYSRERNGYLPEIYISTYDSDYIEEFSDIISNFKFKPYVFRNLDHDAQKYNKENYIDKSYINIKTLNLFKSKYTINRLYASFYIYGSYSGDKFYADIVEVRVHNNYGNRMYYIEEGEDIKALEQFINKMIDIQPGLQN